MNFEDWWHKEGWTLDANKYCAKCAWDAALELAILTIQNNLGKCASNMAGRALQEEIIRHHHKRTDA